MENKNSENVYQAEVRFFGEKPPVPNTNMPLAIVSTVLSCCSFNCIGLLLGIIAIIFASQVNSNYIAQNYVGAHSASKNARILSLVALGLFILGIIINLIYLLIHGFSYSVSQYQDIIKNI